MPDGMASLLLATAAGDRNAFARLYDTTAARVFGVALRVLRDAGMAEDTVQEVYLQIWRTATNFDPERGTALSWIITLTHRRAVDRVRSEQSSNVREAAYGAASTPTNYDTVSESVTEKLERSAVRDCLEQLTAAQRESIELAYYGGHTYREVAELLDTAVPTVKSRIRDGLVRLRRCMV